MTDNGSSARYSRQLGIKDWGSVGQSRLSRSRVLVAGAGGLGSPVLFYLAAAGIGSLVICDFDRIDITNLNRQLLHNPHRIGKLKAESAGETLKNFNPDPDYIIINELITDKNGASIISGCDLVIDCFDNFKSRHILNKICFKAGIPMIHAGVAGFQGQVSFIHPPETACLGCFLPDTDTSSTTYVAGASAGVIGSLQAVEALKYLTGIGCLLKNKILFWDGLSMSMETIKISPNPKCRICAMENGHDN